MTDVTQEEFEALKERVAELESQFEDRTVTDTPPGLDQRDMTVIDYMRENGRRSGFQLVQLYKRLTDVTNKNTAKGRAKALEKHAEYKDL